MDLEPASSRPDMQQPRVPSGKPGAGRWDHKPGSEPAAIADAATAADSGGPVDAVTVVLDGARVGFHSQGGRWRCDEPADRAAAARAGCLGVVADFLNRGWADPADRAGVQSISDAARLLAAPDALDVVDKLTDTHGRRVQLPETEMLAALIGAAAVTRTAQSVLMRSVVAGFWTATPPPDHDHNLTPRFWQRLETLVTDTDRPGVAKLDAMANARQRNRTNTACAEGLWAGIRLLADCRRRWDPDNLRAVTK